MLADSFLVTKQGIFVPGGNGNIVSKVTMQLSSKKEWFEDRSLYIQLLKRRKWTGPHKYDLTEINYGNLETVVEAMKVWKVDGDWVRPPREKILYALGDKGWSHAVSMQEVLPR